MASLVPSERGGHILVVVRLVQRIGGHLVLQDLRGREGRKKWGHEQFVGVSGVE